jgi:hypothetical protein
MIVRGRGRGQRTLIAGENGCRGESGKGDGDLECVGEHFECFVRSEYLDGVMRGKERRGKEGEKKEERFAKEEIVQGTGKAYISLPSASSKCQERTHRLVCALQQNK